MDEQRSEEETNFPLSIYKLCTLHLIKIILTTSWDLEEKEIVYFAKSTHSVIGCSSVSHADTD